MYICQNFTEKLEVTYNISERLCRKLTDYCNLNNIDISEYVENAVNKCIMVDMYGNTPFSTKDSFYGEIPEEPTTTTTTTTRKPRVRKSPTTTTTVTPEPKIVESKPVVPIRKKRKL